MKCLCEVVYRVSMVWFMGVVVLIVIVLGRVC